MVFTIHNCNIRHALRIALFFGGFQAFMPIIGWAIGKYFSQYITSYDHWIAFGLLSFIGGKMIYEAHFLDETGKKCDYANNYVITGLAIATSIDALAVGLSFSFLNIQIVNPVIIIGSITFVISLAGVQLGSRFGGKFGNKMEIIGGIILIAIGLKILLQHLYFT